MNITQEGEEQAKINDIEKSIIQSYEEYQNPTELKLSKGLYWKIRNNLNKIVYNTGEFKITKEH